MRRHLLSAAILAVGCGGQVTEAADTGESATDTDTGPSCVIASLDCECTSSGSCEPGLECVAGVCAEPASDEESGACTELGCACEGEGEEACDEGLSCIDGVCGIDTCGDGIVDPGEACDDANNIDGDGCDNDCTPTEILELSLGGVHTCALIEGGRIRCWGHNGAGQIGLGATEDIGDNETPSLAPDLPLPAAVDVEAGGAHTCALFENGDVRCWGFNSAGQLGYGNTAEVLAIGDNETLEGLAKIDLVAPANEIDVGVLQTCARVAGQLRCWGGGNYGQLGLASTANVGDDELPLDVPAVMIGSEPVKLAVDGAHGCAIMAGGGVRCWGRGDSGQLGLGSTAHIGDNEHPDTVAELELIPPSLPRDTTVVDLAVGLVHSCALLSTGDVLCWGASLSGQIGQGTHQAWGNQAGETPSALTPIELGGPALAIAAGYQHSCALLDGGDVRCWGNAEAGQLGYGDEEPVGLTDLPADRDPLELGGTARYIAAGGLHSCAVLEGEGVICWGNNEYGQLGYGFTHTIGDDELPEVAGLVDLL
ncbi:Regulator of chromosome condensation (RCC1) repeat protein [Enhygromyxa salina]|uniref:Regulator of chromosome condensation (RCC1) repeat protein n=1 Tax=Enhygromyxa salina TaxID=215803 RepID=A0A2S9XCS4_9BACT|nr:DUF4215 domain-containing protein [Enhygromyxa salina]PRP90481.1 Regulator of chromosome condensation (RCC1) repeat protein [Enhygromyxa salina]